MAKFFRMDGWGLLRALTVRSSSVLLLFILSGCAILSPEPPEQLPVPEPVQEPEPEPQVQPEPEPEPVPIVEPAPPPPPEPQNIEPLIAVV